MKAVFLDVDGVIRYNDKLIDECGDLGPRNVIDYSQVKYIPGSLESMCKLSSSYKLFWITLQNCIARGEAEFATIKAVFNAMRIDLELFAKDYLLDTTHFSLVQDIGICTSLPTEEDKVRAKYEKVRSFIDKYGIWSKDSFGVGDSTHDILAFKKAGLKTIQVILPHGDAFISEADFCATSLEEAASIILGG